MRTQWVFHNDEHDGDHLRYPVPQFGQRAHRNRDRPLPYPEKSCSDRGVIYGGLRPRAWQVVGEIVRI